MVHPTLYLDDSSMGISSIDRRLPSGLGLVNGIVEQKTQLTNSSLAKDWRQGPALSPVVLALCAQYRLSELDPRSKGTSRVQVSLLQKCARALGSPNLIFLSLRVVGTS